MDRAVGRRHCPRTRSRPLSDREFVDANRANWDELQITSFGEHRTIPWAALPGLVKDADAARYRLPDSPERLPLTFSVIARRPLA